jgi:uncharacterized protein YvpB
MLQLDVPHICQAPGSLDCGPVCVQMVLKYFGIDRTLEFLRAKLWPHYQTKRGSYLADHGALLLDEGYRVDLVIDNRTLFPEPIMGIIKDNELTVPYINDILQNPQWAAWHSELEVIKRFLEKGGEIRCETPSLAHIKQSIDCGSPVIAHIYGDLYGNGGSSSHAIVICGYEGDKVIIRDPAPGSNPGSMSAEHVLRLVHAASSTSSPVGGGLILPY